MTFLSVYTAIHAIVLWGVYPLLKGRKIITSLCCLWVAIMISSRLASRILEHHGHEPIARILAWTGFSWMGFAILAFSMFSVLFAWEILAWLTNEISSTPRSLSIHNWVCAVAVLIITSCVIGYGIYEAVNIRIEKVVIKTPKLAPGSSPITVAQISDMHLGLLRGKRELADVVAKLRKINPDVVVATGDTVDALPDSLGSIAYMLADLKPPLGKFAVTGNHEYYIGMKKSVSFLESCGFTMLQDKGVAVSNRLNIAGVDDPVGGIWDNSLNAMAWLDTSHYTIMLKHRPSINEAAAAIFDLQLSGHTHGGQIFPFSFIMRPEYPMQNGLYALASGSLLYTSRGTGTWGPPMRIAAPPEITVFEIQPE